jgi:putative toxin-antitoxin system antitoxin component (TIGR02293 family)
MRSKVAGAPRPLLSFLFPNTDPSAVAESIVGGRLTADALARLRARLQMTIPEVAALLGVSARTIVRKEQRHAKLSPTEADRAYRLARIADSATAAIGDQADAIAWLREPSAYLGGKTPLRMLETEIGTELVLESLQAIAYGGVA